MEKSDIESMSNVLIAYSLQDPENRASFLLTAKKEGSGVEVCQAGAGNAVILIDAIAHAIVKEESFGQIVLAAVQKAKVLSSLSGEVGLN